MPERTSPYPPGHPAVTGVTGSCARKLHGVCSGALLTATGWRWFCACTCHPEPEVRSGHKKALDQWRKDREAFAAQIQNAPYQPTPEEGS